MGAERSVRHAGALQSRHAGFSRARARTCRGPGQIRASKSQRVRYWETMTDRSPAWAASAGGEVVSQLTSPL
jgi:hypothetical protein